MTQRIRKMVDLLLGVAIVMTVGACGGIDGGQSTSNSSEGEAFLAYGASLTSSGELSIGSADVVTFSIEEGSLVPDTRLANGSSAGLISVFDSLSSSSVDYEGFPILPDGSFVVWQQSAEVNYLELISPKNGERKRIFRSASIGSVAYYFEDDLFVVNADFCYAVRTSGETRRLGRGQCEGSKSGLRFITTEKNSLSIYVVSRDLELTERRTFPLKSGRLTAGGALIFGESASDQRLVVFDVVSGERLWSESQGDIEATVLSVAEEGDSLVIGQDRDDGDSRLDLIAVISDSDGTRVVELGSERSVGVQLSTNGKHALIASRTKLKEDYSFRTVSLNGGEVPVPFQGSPEGIAVGKSGVYLYVSNETLFVGRFGQAPSRAFDLFGTVTQLVEVVGTNALLVITEFEGESTVTALTVGDEQSARVVAEGPGSVDFSSQFGGRSGKVLFALREDDGYGTLYEVEPASDGRAKRIAEGNIAAFSYGPGGDVYYVDAFGGSYSSYRVPNGDRGKRLLVSSRYFVLRQGPQQLRETNAGLQGFMDAYVDPTQEICAREGIKTVAFALGATEIQIPEIARGSASLCIKVPKSQRGQKVTISHEISASDKSSVDTAIEVYSSTEDMRDEVVRIDDLKLVTSNDDSFVNGEVVLGARIASVVFDRPTYLIRSSSWSEKVDANVRIDEAPNEEVSESYGFVAERWRARADSFAECKAKPRVGWLANKSGPVLSDTVGVDDNGNSEIYEFCVDILTPSNQEPTRFDLVVTTTGTGSSATSELVLGCANLKGIPSLGGDTYRASRAVDFLTAGSAVTRGVKTAWSMSYLLSKGVFGPCFVTHSNPNPTAAGFGAIGSFSIGVTSIDG